MSRSLQRVGMRKWTVKRDPGQATSRVSPYMRQGLSPSIASNFGNRLYKPCYNKPIFKALLCRCALQATGVPVVRDNRSALTIITNSLKEPVRLIRIVEFAKNLCYKRPIVDGFTENFSDLCISVRVSSGYRHDQLLYCNPDCRGPSCQ